jgi:hypothetical protein
MNVSYTAHTAHTAHTSVLSGFCDETLVTQISLLFFSSISLAMIRILIIINDDIEDEG